MRLSLSSALWKQECSRVWPIRAKLFYCRSMRNSTVPTCIFAVTSKDPAQHLGSRKTPFVHTISQYYEIYNDKYRHDIFKNRIYFLDKVHSCNCCEKNILHIYVCPKYILVITITSFNISSFYITIIQHHLFFLLHVCFR